MDDYELFDIEARRPLKHSGFGIASFIITLAAGFVECALIAMAGVLEAADPGGLDENSPIAMLLGLALFGGMFIALLGIALGVVGLSEKHRKKPFAVLGVVIGALVLVGVLMIMAVGLAMEP